MQEETKAYLETRKKTDIFETFKTQLLEASGGKDMGRVFNRIKSVFHGKTATPLLNSRNAELGLLLINQMSGYDEKSNPHADFIEVEYLSKRYKRMVEILAEKPWETEDQFKLLEYFLGEEKAAYAAHAWYQIPFQMYQTGYTRRSFRSPNDPELWRRHQINFIIRIIAQSYTTAYDSKYNRTHTYFDLTIVEQMRYSHLLGESNPQLFRLWSAAIDQGNAEVFQIAEDILFNRDPEGKVTRSILKALLNSSQQKSWELVEKLTLAAQKQEGLRQTIFEALDETSIGALKYMIRVIIDHNLARFSSVVRAVDVWVGLGWESERENTVRSFLEKASYYLENEHEIPKGVYSENNADSYMALWAQGVYDVEKTLPFLNDLIRTGNAQKRTLAVLFADQTANYKIRMPVFISVLGDPELQPLGAAAASIYHTVQIGANDQYYNRYYPHLFDMLHTTFKRVTTKEKTFESFIFSWMKIHFERRNLLKSMVCLVGEFTDRLHLVVSYVEDMDAETKRMLSRKILPKYTEYNYKPGIKAETALSEFQHQYAFLILKDRSEFDIAFKALFFEQLTREELAVIPDWLKRKAAGFRGHVIRLLLRQKDKALIPVVTTLLTEGDIEQRLAGMDILLQLRKENRLGRESNAWIENLLERKTISPKEQILLDQLSTGRKTDDFSAAYGFGLYDPKTLGPVVKPSIDKNSAYERLLNKNPCGLSMPIEKIRHAFDELASLLETHKGFEYEVETYTNSKEKILLGNLFRQKSQKLSYPTKRDAYLDYPLPEVWEEWYFKWEFQPFDLLILKNTYLRTHDEYGLILSTQLPAEKDFLREKYWEMYRYNNPVLRILNALTLLPEPGHSDQLLVDASTHLFSQLSEDFLKKIPKTNYIYTSGGTGWQQIDALQVFLKSIDLYMMKDSLVEGIWKLYHWRQFSGTAENIPKNFPPLVIFCRAYELGLIGKADMFRGLATTDSIRTLSAKKKSAHQFDYFSRFSFLQEMFTGTRDRLLDIELKRGDSPTAATHLMAALGSLAGIGRLTEILAALGTTTLQKGFYYWDGNNEPDKQTSLSHLLKNSVPLSTDSQENFNAAVKKIGVPEKRLIEVAMYAPQWQPFISSFLGWKGLDSAVWWMHAHTKTDGYRSMNAETESEVARYSTLDVEEFKQGAVDKEWFLKAYKEIGKDRWPLVYDAAKYITDGNGHRRARIYADVLNGTLTITDITEKISSKRDQDYVRIYGLTPLNKTNPGRDILTRYEFLQQIKKESRQFGALKQTSEAAAIRVGMENLARNAGYPDPMRLTWAMEIKQVQSILSKETEVHYDETSIRLIIDKDGEADVVAYKVGKELKSIPPKYKKDKKVEELNGFKKTLVEQFRRSRKGLEEAMVRGDQFKFSEIRELFEHPVIARHLEKLVFVTDREESKSSIHGFFKDGHLVDDQGQLHPIEKNDILRIAHCTDLFSSKSWAGYQHGAFEQKLQQPFKQIFRELYLPTADELREVSVSRRYAGHQVQPKQTAALLKSRGWKINHEEGLQKVYHKEKFAACLYAMADWFSPADIESPTLEEVVFRDLKTNKNVAFENIHPRIFSEVMRDVDLVVSVAHAGAVDPEASHSTIEMRSVLLHETARLFKLDNIEIEGSHVRIKGTMGEYSVHIGSAVVHKMSSGYLSILPVHSQHRGRIFLPFIDDDPRSAELLSKVLLLARDKEIQDPTILSQLNG